jgi:hypothetical protein
VEKILPCIFLVRFLPDTILSTTLCILQVAQDGAYALHYRYITKGGFYMEWMNRGERQGQPTGQPVSQTAGPAHAAVAAKTQRGNFKVLRSMRLAQIVLLFLITILVVAVVAYIAVGGPKKAESSFVDDSKLQAVFLNGGQVYFGDITDLNGKFLSMSNIYYLRVNQQVQPNQSTTSTNANDISLVKLGCELHGPTDSMVINREQIIFWENLKDDGQVAKAVAEYKKSNPGEQKCDQTTSNTSNTANTANTSNTANTNTTNNSTSNTSTTKKP